MNLLRHTVNRTRKVEVHELKVVREPYSQFVELDPDGPEWGFYQRVTAAIREYAWKRGVNDGFLLAPPQRQVSSCMNAAARSWLDKSRVSDLTTLVYEDLGADDVPLVGVSPLIEHLLQEVMPYVDIETLRLDDTKYDPFSGVVREHLERHPGEKLIVFSFFKGTLRYLAERLGKEGVATQLLHGGIGETKQDVISNRCRRHRGGGSTPTAGAARSSGVLLGLLSSAQPTGCGRVAAVA